MSGSVVGISIQWGVSTARDILSLLECRHSSLKSFIITTGRDLESD